MPRLCMEVRGHRSELSFLSTVGSKDQTHLVRLGWQVLLPTEPFGQPSYLLLLLFLITLETEYCKIVLKKKRKTLASEKYK